MKIRQKLIGSLITLGAFGIVLGPGCADNRSSIFAVGALVVPQETCTVEVDPEGPFLPGGSVDLAFAPGYAASILLGNQLVSRANAATLRTETSRVSLYEAVVRLTDSEGNDLADGTFFQPLAGFLNPGTGSEASYGNVAVTLIDGQTATTLRSQLMTKNDRMEVIANVIIHGETLGNIEVETDEWAFPITVCNGCSVYFPPAADDPSTAAVDCDVRMEAPVYCRPGMDTGTDCRACAGTRPDLCLAPSP